MTPAGDRRPDRATALLAWYDRAGRDLPWRLGPEARARGVRPDPYRVWLSEVMLQQTRVATVIPYFLAFLARWPTVAALADAPLESVLENWAGLGYYSRARNLHACAREVVRQHRGRFPDDEAALRRLPGIGPYTAAAIAAIAFDAPTLPVDGNIERVLARLHDVQDPLPGARPALRRLAAAWPPTPRPGDLAQALMDLGATRCTPRKPDCPDCPLLPGCAAGRAGRAAELPRRRPRPARLLRHGVAYLARRRDGAIWLVRRPRDGLLGGMLGLPGTDWSVAGPDADAIRAAAPAPAAWRSDLPPIRHVFTHFELCLELRVATLAGDAGCTGGAWVSAADLPGAALPSVMRKAIAAGCAADPRPPAAGAGPATARALRNRRA